VGRPPDKGLPAEKGPPPKDGDKKEKDKDKDKQ
jgi:hypothetical protein